MKLYIPTSSLNFNNIFSTESISPKNFYERRGFGYSRWFTIPENENENVTFLYESPRSFVRPKSDMEDHPMLLEITTDEDYPILQDGVHYTDKTIYLNPWNTNIVFFNVPDMNVALSLSDSSLETKMTRLYKKKIHVMSYEGTYPCINNFTHETNVHEIEKDRIINKLKGLLYGYYIGANMSMSSNNVRRISYYREVQNIFSSIISSIDKNPSTAQSARLTTLFQFIEEQEPIYIELKEAIGNIDTLKTVTDILRKYGHNISNINKNQLLKDLQDDSQIHNKSLLWIKNKLHECQNEANQQRTKLATKDEEIIITDGACSKLTVIKDKLSNALYKAWINDVLVKSCCNGKIISVKEKLSDDLTDKALEVYGEKWKDSEVRDFLNKLRRHVRGAEFDKPWDNGILSAIAATLTKGDDWNKMLLYMQDKGINDYRLAFSFYGVLNGFANLSRDFTDLLLTLENTYIADVYKEFYGQLHGKDIIENIQDNIENRIIENIKTQKFRSPSSL